MFYLKIINCNLDVENDFYTQVTIERNRENVKKDKWKVHAVHSTFKTQSLISQ